VAAPQYSDALTVMTGPGVPLPGAVGMTSPRIRTRKSPSRPKRAVPRVRTQGAPPALAPFSTGSLGTLGARDVLSNASPRWRPWSPVSWPAALTAVVAEPAIAATDSTATALPVDKCISYLHAGSLGSLSAVAPRGSCTSADAVAEQSFPSEDRAARNRHAHHSLLPSRHYVSKPGLPRS